MRLGIIGTGFGRYGLLPAFRRDPCVTVSAIAGSSDERAGQFAKSCDIPHAYGDWRRLLEEEELDALAVAVPPAVQEEAATRALSMGLPVFAEKPMATSLEAAERLADLAARNVRPNMIDFIFPELETWRRAKELLEAEAIGTLRHFFVNWRMETFDVRNRILGWKTGDEGGGVMSHFGSHTLYYVEWLLGPIVALGGLADRSRDVSSAGETLDVLGMRLSSGVSGSVVLCSAATSSNLHAVEISGTEGRLLLINDTPDPILGFRVEVWRRGESKPFQVEREPDRRTSESEDSRVQVVAALASRFVRWVMEGEQSRPDFGDGLRVQRLLDAANRSLREERIVTV